MDIMTALISREGDLERLRRWRDKDMIKVVTGVRRCGKSTLLSMFATELLAGGVPSDHIVSLHMEDMSVSHLLRDPQAFYHHIAEQLPPQSKSYLFIDEIQLVESFETALNGLTLKFNVDIYLTGSNAQMLSSDLATRLSGRYVEIHLLPLSYIEFAEARQGRGSPTEDLSFPGLYASFMNHGGFPFIQELIGSPQATKDYLEGIISTILIKDVSIRQKIGNVSLLTDVTSFLFSNIGSLTSLRRISDSLGTHGRKPAATTIDSYIDGLVDAFVVYPVRRWDVKGLRYLTGPDKYYAVDTGMRNTLVGYTGGDSGHLLENIVYLELRRRNPHVSIGSVPSGEVDFVTVDGAHHAYYQVCQSVRTPETLARELASLQAIKDNHPKYLLTLDAEPPISHNGIQQIYVLDWLRYP